MRAAGVVGLMTLTSRILGMIRDIVTAGRFGTSWQWDSFIYAFMLPNFLRRLVGEGALSSAFIPVYSDILEKKGKDAAFRFGNVVGTFLTAGLVVFLLIVEAVLQGLLRIEGLPERIRLAIELLQIFFPYLFFISLFALTMGILNSHRHFFTPSLGPVILDLAWIAGVLWLVPMAGSIPEVQLHVLAWILLFSGILQFAVDIPPLLKMGFKIRWIWDLADEGLRKSGQLLLPAILGFAVSQLNMLLDMMMGYLAGAGANSALWYGTRLMQFPLGVFGIAMGTALLPLISQQIARGDKAHAVKTMSFALRSVNLILMPSTVGLIVLGVPIIQLLFQRGEFDAVSTSRTAGVLFCYSIGLVAFSGEKLMAAGFFAAHDTKTPVKLGVLSLLANVVMNLAFLPFLKEAGLALSTSITSILEMGLLIWIFQKKQHPMPLAEILRSSLKTLAASLAMGVVAFITYRLFSGGFPGDGTTVRLIRVFGTIFISGIAYTLFCLLLRVSELHEAVDFARRRFARKKD